MSAPKSREWFKYLDAAQLCLNTTPHRSIGTTPFRVLLDMYPHVRYNLDIKEILENELIASFNEDRDELRQQAKENIEKIQRENRAIYDRKRKKPGIM